MSVILLMKNNILRAYISIEMATFQKKVNHALSPEEATKRITAILKANEAEMELFQKLGVGKK